MDRCGVLSECLFTVLYTVLAVAQSHALTFSSSGVEAKHPLRLLLCAGISAACSGMWLLTVESLLFSKSGTSFVALYLWGKCLRVWSKFAFAWILILLSKGRCISRPLRKVDLYLVGGWLAPFFGTCLLLEIWGEYAQSRTYTTDFVYCSRFGAFLVLMDLCLLVLYLVFLRRSHQSEADGTKKKFYFLWAPVYALSFLTLPVATLVSFFVAPWVQSRVMLFLTNGVHVVMLASLVLGLWPERTQSFFCIDDHRLATTIGMTDDLLEPEMDNSDAYLHMWHSPQNAEAPKSFCIDTTGTGA